MQSATANSFFLVLEKKTVCSSATSALSCIIVYKRSAVYGQAISGIASYGITAQIFDVQGLLLKTVLLYNEKTQIDVSNLAKGFYIVKVGSEAKKLVVK